MEINLYLLIIGLFVLLFALPFLLMILLKNKRKILKPIMCFWLVLYLASIFVGTTATIDFTSKSMIISYDFSAGWFSMSFLWAGSTKMNFFINIIMMFPIGLFAFTFCEKHQFIKTILFSLTLSIVIELYQFVLPVARNTEILDLVLNTLSGVISACYFWIFKKFRII